MTEFAFIMEYRRILDEEVFKNLHPNKVCLLFGARRVGKTTLIKKLAKQLDNVQLLNGEDADVHDVLARRSIANYQALFAHTDVLIIDEAQAVPEIGKILKLIIDEIPHIKVVASGSSSFDLLNLSGEPLTGRCYEYTMFPIAESELALAMPLTERISTLNNRLVFGTYPEVLTLKSNKEKTKYLKQLVSTYLLKDILAIDGLRNTAVMHKLLKLIAYQVGSQVSNEELAKQLGISKNTVEKYLDLLHKTYILFPLQGFSRNLRKEVTKLKKWFFYDNGIRNAVIGNLNVVEQRQDIGILWENYMISERIKKNQYDGKDIDAYFWRTYDQQEIDLIESVDKETIHAFEMKWKKKKVKIPGAFPKAYPDASFEVVYPTNYWEYL